MKKLFFGIIILVVIIAITKTANTNHVKDESTVSSDSTQVMNSGTVNTTEIEKSVSNWNYSEQKDAMTDKTMYFAIASSINNLNFDFPYDGGSTLYIQIRKKDGTNEVMLNISKGQFNSAYDNVVSMKFDNGGITKYGFDEPSGGSSNLIFLHSPKSIIDKIKKAKHLKIEAPFYQAGRQVAEFNIGGLDWKQ